MVDFIRLLVGKKSIFLDKWFSVVIDSYPENSSNFLKLTKNPFSNPVGKTIFKCLSDLLECLINGSDKKDIELFIDPIIRIRAVQGFKPSKAVGFIFDLKQIIRENLNEDLKAKLHDELFLFYGRVDILAIVAFDVYMACREQLYELKANESRSLFFNSLNRAGLIVDT